MNRWQKIVSDLLANGWTQQSLGEKAGCAQATISDIYQGNTKSPRADLAMALMELHKTVSQEAANPSVKGA